jgi:hypothetical protein
MEMTLGRIVDSFEPLKDKTPHTNVPAPQTLEEEYMVSSVDKVETEGVKMLEIPAGDYVPVTRPTAAPIITSVTNGRNGLKPRVEISQEPLIEDIDQEQPAYLDAFIEAETREVLISDADRAAAEAFAEATLEAEMEHEQELQAAEESTVENESLISQGMNEDMFGGSNLADMITSEHSANPKLSLDFPSLDELQSLATELMSLNSIGGAPSVAQNTQPASNLSAPSTGQPDAGAATGGQAGSSVGVATTTRKSREHLDIFTRLLTLGQEDDDDSQNN